MAVAVKARAARVRRQAGAEAVASAPPEPVLRGRSRPCADSLVPLPSRMQPPLPPLTLPYGGFGALMLGHVLNLLESRRRGGEKGKKLKTSGSELGSN